MRKLRYLTFAEEKKQKTKSIMLKENHRWKQNSRSRTFSSLMIRTGNITAQQPLPRAQKKSMNPKAPRVVTDMHMGETIQIMILALGN